VSMREYVFCVEFLETYQMCSCCKYMFLGMSPRSQRVCSCLSFPQTDIKQEMRAAHHVTLMLPGLLLMSG